MIRSNTMDAPQYTRGTVLLYSLVLLILTATSTAQDGSSSPTEDKRNVATLARNGDLPMIRQEYKKFAHPMTWQAGNGGQEAEKRFLHPIATSWQDHTVQESQEDKRFSHPVALPWQAQANFQDAISKRFSHPLTAALERHIQRALDKRFSHPMTAAALQQLPSRYLEDKRFLGSLARAGNIGSAGKRSDEDYMTDDEVADALLAELVAEFFQRQQEEERELEEENSLEKRFVASLARTGGLPSGKRNIAAMARDGLLTQFSRTHQDHQEPIATDNNEATAEEAEAVESLLDEVTKRHLGSLARSFNMPAGLTSGGKRNVGALARSGMLTRYTNNQRGEDDKRIRDSFVDPGKRNIQALLKSWRPIDQYNTGHGQQQQQQNDGQKRHLGSLYSTSGNRPKNIQKKSVNPPIADGIVVGGTASSLSVGGSAVARSKRQAFIDDSILGSIEYPMPVLQGSDFYDYEEDLPAAVEEKRFLGSLAKSGWMPTRQIRSPTSIDEDDEDTDEFEDEDRISKRHIGALARIGWLPSFRSTRMSRNIRSAPPLSLEDEFHTWAEEVERRAAEEPEVQDVDHAREVSP